MDGDLNGLLSAPSAGVDTQKWSIIMLESYFNCIAILPINHKHVELHVHDLDKGQALEAPQPIPSSFDARTPIITVFRSAFYSKTIHSPFN